MQTRNDKKPLCRTARAALPVRARRAARRLAIVLLLACVSAFLMACADTSLPERGKILAADGSVLAETVNPQNGRGSRAYPQGALVSPVVGSCYTEGAPDGIEQTCEAQLLAGEDVMLTIDPAIQQAAVEALGKRTGAAVVLDANTGAVLAMASTPAYGPTTTQAEADTLANHATELHIPGSTFKTVTLAAALDSGAFTLDSVLPAPPAISFQDGAVVNYGDMSYPDQTLLDAFAQSVNTVFAQVALQVGEDDMLAMARNLGFGNDLMDDLPLEQSVIHGAGGMSVFMQAWTGAGQALHQEDGTLVGPEMTAVQGALIAAAVANGGTVYAPYLVESVGQDSANPTVLTDRFASPETVDAVAQGMHEVVENGIGKSASVEGLSVAGKTGTAETGTGFDDGWFIGFCEIDGTTYALAVLVEEAESAEASHAAAHIFSSLK